MKKNITLILLVLLMNYSDNSVAENEPKNSTPKQETTTGFMQEITENRVYDGPMRSGKEIYEYRCQGCHGRNTQGAPLPDDKFDWSRRLKKGFNVLMEHSMNGYENYLMPPKGGCRNCREQEIRNAVLFMLKTSGATLPKELQK